MIPSLLVLLSLYAYSVGAVAKTHNIKPHISDLVAIVFLWVAFILVADNYYKWVLFPFCASGSMLTALTMTLLRKPIVINEETYVGNFLKRAWHQWVTLSKEAGAFQGRVVLSLFYFIVVSPIAMTVKKLSDPLGIKNKDIGSQWFVVKSWRKQCGRQF